MSDPGQRSATGLAAIRILLERTGFAGGPVGTFLTPS